MHTKANLPLDQNLGFYTQISCSFFSNTIFVICFFHLVCTYKEAIISYTFTYVFVVTLSTTMLTVPLLHSFVIFFSRSNSYVLNFLFCDWPDFGINVNVCNFQFFCPLTNCVCASIDIDCYNACNEIKISFEMDSISCSLVSYPVNIHFFLSHSIALWLNRVFRTFRKYPKIKYLLMHIP